MPRPRRQLGIDCSSGFLRDDARPRAGPNARAWKGAYEALVRADEAEPLGAQDLERLATAAFMLGRDDDYLGLHERAHHAYLGGDDLPNAVRCAFWVGLKLVLRGEMGPGSGWLGRAQRVLHRHGEDCVERAYLLTPQIFQLEAAGDFAGAAATAAEMLAIAERFGDPDFSAIARHAQGQMLMKTGQVKDGLALMDEAMVAVTAGELSPVVTGIVYCGVILALQEAYEVRRAREWTAALTRWCNGQPDEGVHRPVSRAPRGDP